LAGRLVYRLIERLRGFRSCKMITLTVDHALFDGPGEAYDHIVGYRRGRFGADGERIERSTASAIPRIVERLFEKCLLHSRDWFCALEFQRNDWPHWHMLVDSDVDSKILQHAVEKEWAKFIPLAQRKLVRPSVTDTRHSLGYVTVTDPPGGVQNARAAGIYAGYYCYKPLKRGQSWPDWVMEGKYRIPRYSRSRGFWNLPVRRSVRDPSRIPRHYRVRSHRERLASCRRTLVFLRRQERIDLRTGEVRRVRQFCGKADVDGYALLDAVRVNGYPEHEIYIRGAFLSAKTSIKNLCAFLRPIVARGFGAGRLRVGAQFRVQLC
jgi:hypothetical protein